VGSGERWTDELDELKTRGLHHHFPRVLSVQDHGKDRGASARSSLVLGYAGTPRRPALGDHGMVGPPKPKRGETSGHGPFFPEESPERGLGRNARARFSSLLARCGDLQRDTRNLPELWEVAGTAGVSVDGSPPQLV
jgi:hypothetical protein